MKVASSGSAANVLQAGQGRRSPRVNLARWIKLREAQLALILVVMSGAIGLRAPLFLSPRSIDSLLTDSSILVMMALAQMLVIVTRGIDLSVAANLALCGMAVALLGERFPGAPVALLVPAALACGLALGSINGALIGFLGLPPIVVTLGSMSVFRGSIFVLSGGAWVSAHQMSPAFINFPLERPLGLTNLVWCALAAALRETDEEIGLDRSHIEPLGASFTRSAIIRWRRAMSGSRSRAGCSARTRSAVWSPGCAATCGWHAMRSPSPRSRTASSSA